ncbi:hypothetical protein [Anaeromicrobium sediminis]|uniref:hypothetical protein n=1 Tax=Anaeromicrobium sediminis TaxID=1478221 RepID=UPI001595E099|nr:hypothetical protein [Anaeromicrobium sediminis]
MLDKKVNEIAMAVEEMALAGGETIELIDQAKEVLGKYGQAMIAEFEKVGY